MRFDHQRHLDELVVVVPAAVPEMVVVIPEAFTVIGDEDDHGVVVEAVPPEVVDQLPDTVVEVADLLHVHPPPHAHVPRRQVAGCAAEAAVAEVGPDENRQSHPELGDVGHGLLAEERPRVGVGQVRVVEVEKEEEPPLAVPIEEGPRLDQVLVRLMVDPRHVEVGLETLVEPAVSQGRLEGDPVRRPTRRTQPFGEGLHRARQLVEKAEDAVGLDAEAREDRRERGPGPVALREGVREEHAVARESVDGRRDLSRKTVAPQPVRPQGVDGDQQDVRRIGCGARHVDGRRPPHRQRPFAP